MPRIYDRAAAEAAAAALTADPYRSDTLIATQIGVSQQTVSHVRAELAESELIPAVPLRSRAGTGRNAGAYDRASAELVTNAHRSNYLIAQLADCSAETAGRARYDLERAGLIGYVPAIERIPKLPATAPRPAATSAARVLIDDAARSDALIAEAAGCSRITAGRARIQLEAMGLIAHVPPAVRAGRAARNPRYADAAGAAEALRVRAEAACEGCGQPFAFTPRRRGGTAAGRAAIPAPGRARSPRSARRRSASCRQRRPGPKGCAARCPLPCRCSGHRPIPPNERLPSGYAPAARSRPPARPGLSPCRPRIPASTRA